MLDKMPPPPKPTTRELLIMKTRQLQSLKMLVRRADAERRGLLLRLADEMSEDPETTSVSVLVPPLRRSHLRIRKVTPAVRTPTLHLVKTTPDEGEKS